MTKTKTCSRCPKPPAPGRKMCRKHLAAARASVVAFREAHRKKGLCLYCNKKRRKGKKTCTACAAERKLWHSGWYERWKKKQQKRADVPKKPKPKRPIKVPKPPVKRPPAPTLPPAAMRCLFTGNKKRCKADAMAGQPVCAKHQAFAATIKIPEADTRCVAVGNKKRCKNQRAEGQTTCERHLGYHLLKAMGDLDKVPKGVGLPEERVA